MFWTFPLHLGQQLEFMRERAVFFNIIPTLTNASLNIGGISTRINIRNKVKPTLILGPKHSNSCTICIIYHALTRFHHHGFLNPKPPSNLGLHTFDQAIKFTLPMTPSKVPGILFQYHHNFFKEEKHIALNKGDRV